jgi:hypothetical protein
MKRRLHKVQPSALAVMFKPITPLWRAAHVMTLEHGASEAEVKIRMPVHFWALKLAAGWCGLAIAAGFLWIDHRAFNAPIFLAIGGAQVAGVLLWQRTLGVDLTRESAILCGFRQRRVPWREVQAVVRHGRRGTWRVRLILRSGPPVNLPAPTKTLALGAVQFDRDFHRIDQWWLAHRGQSWRPASAETPPVQA